MLNCKDDATIPAENIVSACVGFISESFQQNWDLQFVPEALVNEAVAYERLGKYEKAEHTLKAATSRYPAYSPAWEHLGKLLEKLKGPGMLMATVDYMIKSNPNNPEVLNNACWIRATAGEQLDTAVADCNESLRLKPGTATTLNSRAFAYFRARYFEHAIDDANAALAIDSKLASSLYVRGLAKLESGDAAGGNADIAAAKTLDPKIQDTYQRYGVLP